jgi:hypothetical protein
VKVLLWDYVLGRHPGDLIDVDERRGKRIVEMRMGEEVIALEDVVPVWPES